MSIILSAGRNRSGQLGTGTLENPVDYLQPLLFDSQRYRIEQAVPTHGEFTLFAAFDVKFNRQVLLGCGRNVEGQLPLRGIEPGTKEVHNLVELDTDMFGKSNRITKITAGSYHTLLQTSDQNVWAVGNNYYGQLGLGHTQDRNSFTKIESNKDLKGKKMKAMCCGAFHSAVLTQECNLYVFGSNGYGQLGQGDKDMFKPTLLEQFRGQVENVFCGVYYTVLLTKNKKVFKFGLTVAEKSIYPNGIRKPVEEKFPGLLPDECVVDVGLNDFETYFLTSKNRIYVRGNSKSHNYDFFTQQQGLTHMTSLLKIPSALQKLKIKAVQCPVAPDAVLLVENQQGNSECWITGRNQYGELGVGHKKTISDFQKLVIDVKGLPLAKISEVTSVVFGDGSMYLVLGRKKASVFVDKKIQRWKDLCIVVQA